MEIGYLLLSLLMAAILLSAYWHGLKNIDLPQKKKTSRIIIVTFLLTCWFLYMYFIPRTGLLQNFERPYFPLLLVFPAFFTILLIAIFNKKSKVLAQIPRSWLVFVQAFRILVESLFIMTVAAGILHPEVTLEGYNYDMIFGISAIIVGLLAYSWKVLSERIILYWNILGLLVLASVIMLFTTTVYMPELWGESLHVNPEFLTFPYVLVPGFLMPVAVFIHILSIKQFMASD